MIIIRMVFLFFMVALISINAGDVTNGDVQKILEVQKRQKGIAVILGSAESGLEVIKGTSMYVHTIINKEEDLQAGRKLIDSNNFSGRGSILTSDSNSRLPYADNLINLVIVQEAKDVMFSAKEVLRIMTPKGYIFVARSNAEFLKDAESCGLKFVNSGSWAYAEKPMPSSFDGWSHNFGNANQSYTNNDTAVGPWQELRWINDPMWGSLYVSYISFVTNGGIAYYQEAHQVQKTGRWFMIARDAYNGVELWRENIGGFLKYIRNPDLTNCCDDKNIYYCEDTAQVARDGLTGKKIMTYKTQKSPEFALVEGKVLVLCSKSLLEAFDKVTGAPLWSSPIQINPTAENGALYLMKENTLKAYEIETGKEIWSTKIEGLILLNDNRIFCKGSNVYVSMKPKYKPDHILITLDAKTGTKKWDINAMWSYGTLAYKDCLWLLNYSNTAENRNKSVSAKIVDSNSGKIEKEYSIDGNAGGHCWPARGAENYLLYSNGWYYDRNKKAEGLQINSTRSPCRIGQIPANGLTYFLPHHCDCKVTLRGFLGLAPKGSVDWVETNENRLKKGKSTIESTEVKLRTNDWPMYRNNYSRTNTSSETLKINLKQSWIKKDEGAKITQAVIANGLVYLGHATKNKVSVFKEDTGDLVWQFFAEGSVLTSPSIFGNYCLVGTGGGYVHALNAKTGEEIWKLRVAPVQKYIGDKNKLDSPWPIQGSILIKNNVAYFCVGRSSSQDLGIYLYGVDITNGNIVWCQKQQNNGLCSDIFFADDKKLYFYEEGFDYATGKIDKTYKPSIPFLKTTNYLNKVSLISYFDSIDPQATDKRHVFLSDGIQLGMVVSSIGKVSVVAGRISTSFEGWKEKHGQFFLRAKGDNVWAHEDMDIQIFGLVTTKDKVYAAGKNLATLKSVLRVYALSDGKQLQEVSIEGSPIYDAISVSNGRVYVSTEEGNFYCFISESKE